MDALIRLAVSVLAIGFVVGFVFAIDPLLGAFVLFFGVPIMWYVTGIGAE